MGGARRTPQAPHAPRRGKAVPLRDCRRFYADAFVPPRITDVVKATIVRPTHTA